MANTIWLKIYNSKQISNHYTHPNKKFRIWHLLIGLVTKYETSIMNTSFLKQQCLLKPNVDFISLLVMLGFHSYFSEIRLSTQNRAP